MKGLVYTEYQMTVIQGQGVESSDTRDIKVTNNVLFLLVASE